MSERIQSKDIPVSSLPNEEGRRMFPVCQCGHASSEKQPKYCPIFANEVLEASFQVIQRQLYRADRLIPINSKFMDRLWLSSRIYTRASYSSEKYDICRLSPVLSNKVFDAHPHKEY